MNRKSLFLFIFLTLFVFMNNVNAAVPTTENFLSCSSTTNLWDSSLNLGRITYSVGSPLSFYDMSESTETLRYAYALNYVSVTAGETYTFSFWNQSPAAPGEITLYYVDSNFNAVSYFKPTDANYGFHNTSFIVPDGVSYLLVYIGATAKITNVVSEVGTNIMFQISKGEVSLASTEDYTTYEACPVVEPDPEPEPEVDPEGMEIITNFYTVYLDRLVNFVSIASTNYVFLSFIAVIVIFIVVELFFKMFRR